MIAGRISTFYITEEGEVYVTGFNASYRLGVGHTINILTPVRVNLNGRKIKNINMDGSDNLYYITEEGEVYVSGDNGHGLLGVGHTNEVSIATKVNLSGVKIKEVKYVIGNTFYITEEGEVYASGDNKYGKLGVGHTNDVLTPAKVNLNGRKIKKIEKIFSSVFYITEEGEVYASGNNEYGQLGLGHTNDVLYATKINALNGVKVKSIYGGNYSNDNIYYVTEEGEVYASGDNEYGQLGLGHTNDVLYATKINALNGVKVNSIASYSGESVYYITEKGEVYASGDNEYGQLGLGHTNDVLYATKIKALNGVKVESIYPINSITTFITEFNEEFRCGDGIGIIPIKGNEKCSVCNKVAAWEQKETMHILVCTKDKSHVMKIEGHELDEKNICKVCGYLDVKDYPIKFKDYTDKNHWAWDNVGHMVEKGIVEGASDGNLYPEKAITAEGVVALLARTLGYDGVDRIAEGTVYKPIESSWSEAEWKFLMKYLSDNGRDAKNEMQVLLSNNGISGTDEEIKNNYNKAMTRERIAHFLGLFLKSNYRQEYLAAEFEDWDSVNYSYRETIRRLSAYDIFRGRLNDGILYVAPTESIKRVEAIALIDRLESVLSLGYTYEK